LKNLEIKLELRGSDYKGQKVEGEGQGSDLTTWKPSDKQGRIISSTFFFFTLTFSKLEVS
jgi:hypothetical protein